MVKNSNRPGPKSPGAAFIYSVFVLSVFALILIIPASREFFIGYTKKHPFIMGFVKHALLAIVGEIFAHRIVEGKFMFPEGFIWRMFIWGFNGMVIALIFPIYGAGVAVLQAQGFIPWNSALAAALFASIVNGVTFGMVLMGFHTITDTIIEMKTENEKISLKEVAARTRWDRKVHRGTSGNLQEFFV